KVYCSHVPSRFADDQTSSGCAPRDGCGGTVRPWRGTRLIDARRAQVPRRAWRRTSRPFSVRGYAVYNGAGCRVERGYLLPTYTLRSRISGANFGARKLADRPILMRRFVLGLCADLGFRAHDFAEPMRVALVQPLVVPLHALVAGGHHLPRVLFPGVERLAFFVLRQIGILGDLVRRLVVICRVLELGLLHFRPRAHGGPHEIVYARNNKSDSGGNQRASTSVVAQIAVQPPRVTTALLHNARSA